eukprot:CAMPEP_0194145780 /NCGR_PEP_ID=MMETSP0152-20130528/18825_1 /TAXON_ID=1049557 /ORGANISM="Thalassiothrix antarctica, Strain L6-D1" /LENGTH=309 /DNA_ID=CAMNT_0038846117 /DNA_START=119 /DNA_END=1048 /DNA_ORIENTATION=-
MMRQLSRLSGGGSRGSNNEEGFDGREVAVDNPNDHRTSLERSVRSRDTTISSMEKKRLEKEQELGALQKELEEERLKQMEEAILHRLEADRLQRQTEAMEERLEALERDMQDKDAIHEYANLIKGVAPKSGVDSQYVMKLQSQLAKAVKKMEATSQQMELVEHSCNEVVASLKTEITEIVEDRCRTELELRKQLELLEEQKAEMQKDYDDQITKNQGEMERLRATSSAKNSGDNNNNSNATSGPNMEGTEVDLKKELEEAENRLENLTKTNEDQGAQITDLNQTLQSSSLGNEGEETKEQTIGEGGEET